MGNITANKARLYESIEDGLSLAGQMIDRCEAYEGEMSAARAVVGKALASLEILRAEMVEGDWYEVSEPGGHLMKEHRLTDLINIPYGRGLEKNGREGVENPPRQRR